MYTTEYKVWNVKDNRVATAAEISDLVGDGQLFINYYVIGEGVGRVFLDLSEKSGYELRRDE